MKGMARAIKRFAHRSGCILIERRNSEKWKNVGHWAPPNFSGGSASGLSATGAWQILTSLGGAAADDGRGIGTFPAFCLFNIGHFWNFASEKFKLRHYLGGDWRGGGG